MIFLSFLYAVILLVLGFVGLQGGNDPNEARALGLPGLYFGGGALFCAFFALKERRHGLSGASFLAFIAVTMACFIVLQKTMFGIETAGWASLMTAIMLVGGLQISVMSFVGVYVGKVFFEVKDRPVFIIAEANNIS